MKLCIMPYCKQSNIGNCALKFGSSSFLNKVQQGKPPLCFGSYCFIWCNILVHRIHLKRYFFSKNHFVLQISNHTSISFLEAQEIYLGVPLYMPEKR
jgi:hypothetical protein